MRKKLDITIRIWAKLIDWLKLVVKAHIWFDVPDYDIICWSSRQTRSLYIDYNSVFIKKTTIYNTAGIFLLIIGSILLYMLEVT